ncbi:MAG: hypothetical protein HYZ75_18920 [Elusimicrobia bacterium]|nr:hypothetical protein [Elusimicrobiota bacterium]
MLFSKTYGRKDIELARALREKGRGVILDICDNHFYNPMDLPRYRGFREDLLSMIALTNQVCCSTPTLAKFVAAEAGLERPPAIVADPVDPALQSAFPAPQPNRPQLLWFGAHGAQNAPCGMEDLLRIAEPLERLSRRWAFELVVVSNSRWKFRKLISRLPFPTAYIPWERQAFPGILARARAVLIPVAPNPFTLSKSSNRLAAALFSGIPVVADAIPSYLEFAEFASLDDWERGLDAVFQQRPLALAKAARGREYLSQRYLPSHIAASWEKVLAPWT